MAITTNNLISKQTVGSAGAASITFSNIPQTFTDLRVVVSSRCDQAGVAPVLGKINFNGSTTTYTYMRIYGDGSSATSSSGSAAYFDNVTGTGATANTFGSDDIYIPNYTSANYKTYSSDTVLENNDASAHTALYCGLWSTVSAITSLSVYPGSGNYTQYTTASLYGISSNTTTQNTSVPSATGGDVITTDGTYWYHAFKYSGTFTPLKALTADYFVAGGGGGGGAEEGAGGGGAGGVQTATGLSLTTTGYTCTIGAGGSAPSGLAGNAGTSSVFSTFTATGGSGGGKYAASGGASGSPQSNAGGSPGTTVSYGETGGGGGGSSSVGGNGVTNTNGGTGGSGTTSIYSGTSTSYAGGGGGGGALNSTGGTATAGGGAGAINRSSNGVAGTVNTGGGGGGSRNNAYAGGAGGSGIVLIRYAV